MIPEHEQRGLLEVLLRGRAWELVREEMAREIKQAGEDLVEMGDVSPAVREQRVGYLNGLTRAMGAPGRILERLPDNER